MKDRCWEAGSSVAPSSGADCAPAVGAGGTDQRRRSHAEPAWAAAPCRGAEITPRRRRWRRAAAPRQRRWRRAVAPRQRRAGAIGTTRRRRGSADPARAAPSGGAEAAPSRRRRRRAGAGGAGRRRRGRAEPARTAPSTGAVVAPSRRKRRRASAPRQRSESFATKVEAEGGRQRGGTAQPDCFAPLSDGARGPA